MQSTLAADEEPAIRMLHHEGLSEIKGRGWFATRDLKPGQLVFRETPIRSRSVEDLAKVLKTCVHFVTQFCSPSIICP